MRKRMINEGGGMRAGGKGGRGLLVAYLVLYPRSVREKESGDLLHISWYILWVGWSIM